MSHRCISCKREIAKKQKNCYICGSTQNYFLRYSIQLVILLMILSLTIWLSFEWYNIKLTQLNEKNEVHLDQQLSEFKQAANKNKELSNQKEEQIDLLKKQIDELKASIASGTSSASDVQNALDKEKARSKWLNRENTRFTQKIKTLTEHISSLEKELTSRSEISTKQNPEVQQTNANPPADESSEKENNLATQDSNIPAIERSAIEQSALDNETPTDDDGDQ